MKDGFGSTDSLFFQFVQMICKFLLLDLFFLDMNYRVASQTVAKSRVESEVKISIVLKFAQRN